MSAHESDLAGKKRIMGVDLGGVRIGIAVSDASNILATPHSVLMRNRDDQETIRALLALAESEDIGEIVVGIPKGLSATNNHAENSTREFLAALTKRSTVKISEIDERFTTVMATRRLRDTGHTAKSMKGKIDAMAAAEILQNYLDHHGNS